MRRTPADTGQPTGRGPEMRPSARWRSTGSSSGARRTFARTAEGSLMAGLLHHAQGGLVVHGPADDVLQPAGGFLLVTVGLREPELGAVATAARRDNEAEGHFHGLLAEGADRQLAEVATEFADELSMLGAQLDQAVEEPH